MPKKLDALTEANQRLAQCLMYDGEGKPGRPLLKGEFCHWGYFRTGLNPREAAARRANWDVYVGLAASYAENLRDVALDSAISSPYYPFLLQLEDSGQDEATAVKQALGLNVGQAFIEVAGDIILEKRPKARSIFWDADIDDEPEEYFSTQAIQTYLQVTASMRQDLKDLQVIRFPDSYIRYPVFFVGVGDAGDLVGVAAFRLDR